MLRPSRLLTAAAFTVGGCALAFPREAHASEGYLTRSFMDGKLFIVLPVVLDAAFTVNAVARVAADERTPFAFAVAEVAVTAPQVLVTSIVFSVPASKGSYPPVDVTVLFAWTTALMTHGIVTLVTGREASPTPPETKPDHPHVGLTPAYFRADARSAPTLGLVATCTF